MNDTKLTVEVILGDKCVTLNDILNLKVGDIIDLDIPSHSKPKMYVNDKYMVSGNVMADTKYITFKAYADNIPTPTLQKIKDTNRQTTIQTNNRPFEFLENISDTVIVRCLENELPHFISLVLTQIPSKEAKRIISKLPDYIRGDVINGMLNIGEIDMAILPPISNMLRYKVMELSERRMVIDGEYKVSTLCDQYNDSELKDIVSTLLPISLDSAYAIMHMRIINAVDDTVLKKCINSLPSATIAILMEGTDERILKKMRSVFGHELSEAIKTHIPLTSDHHNLKVAVEHEFIAMLLQ